MPMMKRRATAPNRQSDDDTAVSGTVDVYLEGPGTSKAHLSGSWRGFGCARDPNVVAGRPTRAAPPQICALRPWWLAGKAPTLSS